MDTKMKIIHSAVDLFAQNGFAGTGMRELAAKVGIKDSSIYNHFSSKQDILGHLVSMYINRVDEIADKKYNEFESNSCYTIDDIVNQIFFSFSPDENAFYTKILKIILHEQYRDKIAGDCVKYHVLYASQMRIKEVLDTLISRSLIEPVDTFLVSKMLCCILVSYSVEYAHSISVDDPVYCDSNTMFDVLRYASANIIKLKPDASF